MESKTEGTSDLENRIRDTFLVEETDGNDLSGEGTSNVADELDIKALCDRMERISGAATKLEALGDDLAKIRGSKLDDEDIVALLYGRNTSITKTEVRDLLKGFDDLMSDLESTRGRRDAFVRLLAHFSGRNLSEVRRTLDDLEALFQKLGSTKK